MTTVIDQPIIVDPGTRLHDIDVTAAAGYTGPAVTIADAWRNTAPVTLARCRCTGFTDAAIRLEGRVDRLRVVDCTARDSGGLIDATGVVWRESWVDRCQLDSCTSGIIIDASGTDGDATNQIDITGLHCSWVDGDLIRIVGRPDRPVRRIRVVGAMLHGPQSRDLGRDLVTIAGNVRDIHFVAADLNNGSTGAALIRIAEAGGKAPLGVSLDVTAAHTAGHGVIVDAGGDVTVRGSLAGVTGDRLRVAAGVTVTDWTTG